MSRQPEALTDLLLKALAPPAKGSAQREIFDSKVPGLSVRISPRGTKAFTVLVQTPGRRRRISIGRYPDVTLANARKQASDIILSARNAQLPPAVQKRLEALTAMSVSELIDQFLEKHVERKLKANTQRQYRYRLEAYVRPEIGDMAASEVRKRDIIALADAIAEEGKTERKSSGRGSKGGSRDGGAPRLADGIVEIVCSMYSWAQRRDILETNPAYRLEKYSTATRRERVLADLEFKIFWDGMTSSQIGEPLPTILQLLLLTGQRRSEVAGARICELDLTSSRPSWTIHRSRTKNGLTHTVPLAPKALALWRHAWATFADDAFVFPASRHGATEHVHPGSVTHAMRLVREHAGLDDLRAHDLRRTVRTRMAALRIPREISARVLNHVDEFERGIHDEAYNRHDYFDEKLEALALWEKEIARLLTPPTTTTVAQEEPPLEASGGR